ncbi:NAD regulator [Hyphomicrobium methylovorum]|uniref:NUDIX hydrolase n=1 Tax=Hyphomicrobium methylovorum TaxID=84 RepID=UPI0015E72E08|nr:NAD regulator [Hyphomicrobium methylovorum]MBA2127278.1 NAD regulator [Hyphomicrobium methylovorum]
MNMELSGRRKPTPDKPHRASEADADQALAVGIGLNAAIVAVADNEPVALVVRGEPDSIGATDVLPFGPFNPHEHRTLESGLRAWVHDQTGLELGYAEQLYTFADRGRHTDSADDAPHIVSIGYLALTQAVGHHGLTNGMWRSWYKYFPWEDWRRGRPDIISNEIEPRLKAWAEKTTAAKPGQSVARLDRARICFGLDGMAWDEEKVLERFELLYESGLAEEALRDGRNAAREWSERPKLGLPMQSDHRRILATAISRTRAKIKYRPVVFELMPDEFTLYELQKAVEAILGPHLHKQNFRRLVEGAGLVEPTGEVKTRTGGRPAKLFRFRRDVLLERPAPGVRVSAPPARN